MIKWLSNLLTRSRQVKNETTDLANTALRVGTLLEDLAKFGISKYDAAAEYETGQYAVFEGVLAEAVANTAPGESPTSAKLKWSLKLVIDPSSITESNNLPVAASAVYAAIQAALANGGLGTLPSANELVKGIVAQASDEEAAAGINNDKYITAKQQKTFIDRLFKDFVTPSLDSITQASDEFQLEQEYNLAKVSGMAVVVDEPDANGILRKVIRFFGGTNSANFITAALSEDDIASIKQRINTRLDDLLREQTISQDIRLPSSNVEVQVGDEHLVHRGWLVKVFRQTGQFVLARFGWFPGGRVGIQNATGKFIGFEANGDDVILDSPYIRANPSRFIAQGYSALTVSQADKEIVGIMVRQYDPATTQYDEKLLGDAELAARLKPFFNSTGVSGDARPVLAVFCRPRSTAPPIQQTLDVTAISDRDTIPHKLKTMVVLADFYVLIGTGAYKRDDSVGLYPSPDANTIKIYVDSPPWTGRIVIKDGLPSDLSLADGFSRNYN